MEWSASESEKAVIALAILSTLPIIIYAIWADSLNRSRTPATLAEEAKALVEKIRSLGLFSLVFLISLFFGSEDTRNEYPFISTGIFLMGILAQLWVQASTEARLAPGFPTDHLPLLIIRGFLAWSLAAFVYLAAVVSCTLLAFGLAHEAQLDGLSGLAIYGISGIVGLSLGLGLNHLCAPIFMRHVLPLENLESDLETSILSQFRAAQLPIPRVHEMSFREIRPAPILLVGLPRASGVFGYLFLLSRWVHQTLTPGELHALIGQHIAEVKLHHGRRRWLLSIFLLGLTLFLSLLSSECASHYLPPWPINSFIGPSVALAGFLLSLQLLNAQRRRLQSLSDAFALDQLGIPLDLMLSGLAKIGPPRGSHHRLENLRKRLPPPELPLIGSAPYHPSGEGDRHAG